MNKFIKSTHFNDLIFILLLLLLLLLSLSITAQAEPAAYKSGVLTLPELVSYEGEETGVFKNVFLRQNQSGYFTLHVGDQRKLAQMQSMSMDADVTRPFPAWVHVEGFKSLQCIELNEVSINWSGHDIYLLVTEHELPANVRCVPGLYPFQLDVKLETSDLEPGENTVYGHQELYLPFTVLE